MGCDIHILVERKVGDEWVCVNTLSNITDNKGSWHFSVSGRRNYARFARLAGVRGDGPEARGWPADASQTANYIHDQWQGDGHSHSWMMLDEALPIFIETEWDELPDPLKKYPADFYFDVEDDEIAHHRIVFFFDN